MEKTIKGQWNLITVNSYDINNNTKAPHFIHNMVRTTLFQTLMMAIVLLNAIVNASFVYNHDKTDDKRKLIYYYIESLF